MSSFNILTKSFRHASLSIQKNKIVVLPRLLHRHGNMTRARDGEGEGEEGGGGREHHATEGRRVVTEVANHDEDHPGRGKPWGGGGRACS